MKHYLTVVLMITVTISQGTGIIRSTTVFSSSAGPWKSVQCSRLHHHLHGYCQSLGQVIILHLHLLLSTITAIRERILQEGETGQLTQPGHIAVAVGIARPGATALMVETLAGTLNRAYSLFEIISYQQYVHDNMILGGLPLIFFYTCNDIFLAASKEDTEMLFVLSNRRPQLPWFNVHKK